MWRSERINALIHELGHAIHFYKQFANESGVQEQYLREEVAELYSHSLELMLMDKLDIFYPEHNEYKKASVNKCIVHFLCSFLH